LKKYVNSDCYDEELQALGWMIGVLGFDSWQGLETFLFTTVSRMALGPTQHFYLAKHKDECRTCLILVEVKLRSINLLILLVTIPQKHFIFWIWIIRNFLTQVLKASYPMGTRGSFPGWKAAGAWSWPLTSI